MTAKGKMGTSNGVKHQVKEINKNILDLDCSAMLNGNCIMLSNTTRKWAAYRNHLTHKTNVKKKKKCFSKRHDKLINV